MPIYDLYHKTVKLIYHFGLNIPAGGMEEW